MAMEGHADRRWWSSKKKDRDTHHKSPLPSAPPTTWLLPDDPLPGERSSTSLHPREEDNKNAHQQLPRRVTPIHPFNDDDAELTQKVAHIMQKELTKLRSENLAKQFLLPQSVQPSNTHVLQEPPLGIRSNILDMEHLSKIKALEMEKAESLEKQWELQEELEMLKGVVTAVSDEKEELQEEVAMLKVALNSVSLEKEELEEEVEMLKNALRSVASEREQHLLRIRALEMELEEHSEQQTTLAEEVEMMRSEQYVLRIQVQEFY